jgi:hypothetical protein
VQKGLKEQAQELTEELQKVLLEGYLPSAFGGRDGRVLRASAMGHPALELAAKYFKVKLESTIDEKTMLTFWLGHSFEAWLSFLYSRSRNVTVRGTQSYHEWKGITGHSDFILTGEDGTTFIADAKAINARAFNKYQRYGLLDDRGYATQLALYSASYGDVPACIIMLNKENGKVDHVWLDENKKEECLQRAKFVKETIEHIALAKDETDLEKFKRCFCHFRPPVPRAEVFRKQYTGRILPPDTMVYSPLRDLLYETYTGTNNRNEEKTYVSDYLYPEEFQQYKPDINADVFD